MKRFDPVHLFFSSAGRLGRRGYAGACLVIAAFTAGFRGLAPTPLERWTGWLVYAALLFAAACVTSKRLHDLGRAGWWSFLPVGAAVAAWPVLDDPADVWWATFLTLWVALLAVHPGQRNANRFGPPP